MSPRHSAKSVPVYSAIFFTPEEARRAYAWWGRERGTEILDRIPKDPHVTLRFRPDPGEVETLPIGEKVSVRVLGAAEDAGAQALLVEAPFSLPPLAHLTLATASGVPPSYSRELLARGFDRVSGPTLRGTVGYYDGEVRTVRVASDPRAYSAFRDYDPGRVNYVISDADYVGRLASSARVAGQYLRATDISPLVEDAKADLARILDAPVSGGTIPDYIAATKKAEERVDRVRDDLALAIDNPYLNRYLEKERRALSASREYARFYDNLGNGAGIPLYQFILRTVEALYRKKVKTVREAFEQVPYLPYQKLSRLSGAADRLLPSAVRADETEVFRILSEAKFGSKIIAALERSPYLSPVREFEKILSDLRTDRAAEPDYLETAGICREFELDGAKILLLDLPADPDIDRAAILSMRKVLGRMKRLGLARAWYGVIAFVSHEQGKLSEDERKAVVEAGYDIRTFAGRYSEGSDRVFVYGYPGTDFEHTLAHELGHRYWFRLLKPAQRAEFADRVITRPSAIPLVDRENALDYLEKWDYLPGDRDLDGNPKTLPAVSNYGGTNAHEAFVELFADYVVGRPVAPEQVRALGRMLPIRTANRTP